MPRIRVRYGGCLVSNRMKMSLIRKLMALCLGAVVGMSALADSIPGGFSRPPVWRIGVEVTPAYVPGTNVYLDGSNPRDKRIRRSLSGSVRTDFSFRGDTKEGMLYKGLYQGIGIGADSFFANDLLGTPVTAYVYQGAPFICLSGCLKLEYEWKFGAAFGWKHYDREVASSNAAVSTPVTAMMGLGVRLNYSLTEMCSLMLGIEGTHFSNGNTSWPNGGVNSIGVSLGVACRLGSGNGSVAANPALEREADRGRWLYDIVAFGAWRKRVVFVGSPSYPELCPGRFGVIGVQFTPLRRLNRWCAVGPGLEVQWDESAGIAPYWVEGSGGDDIKFKRPPFARQISAGLSAHAELTMPIFTVDAGLGYDVVCPAGNRRFYQMLALKTFFTRSVFLNVGYRLGNFKDPQNLMVGFGVRL